MLFRRASACLFVVLFAVSALAVSKKDIQRLPPHYRDWLTREVNYIITNEEAEAFVRFASDAERDNFISRFWEIRNPDPGSPTNRYKDDIYERIAYANQWFGRETGTPGWMTDMGRVYVTLGPPKQRNKQLSYANVRPMEIWFYDNAHPALPPFFYVMFYQRESGGDFRLYSPYMDGPEKLVSSHRAQSGRLEAWKEIDKEAGREVARTALSLLPDEPVDITTANSSLQSDVMLATVKGLANNPFTKDMLNQKRRLLEDVSHRLVMAGDYIDVVTAPLRDAAGNMNVHFLLRFRKPEDFTISQSGDGKYYSSAEVNIRVMTPEGKPIFSQTRDLSRTFDQQGLESVKLKTFGYEGVLPIPPGKYKLHLVLVNKLTKTSYTSDKDLIVPEPPANGLRLSELIPFSSVKNVSATVPLPFQVANLKFTPSVSQNLSLVQGQELNLLYQIWAAAKPKSKLRAEYAFGRMGLQDTKTLTDEIDPAQFDPMGSLVNGKKIPTLDLPVGLYRLTATVTEPDTRERAAATVTFRIVTSQPTPESWDIVDPELEDEARDGTFELNRALCYFSAGKAEEGMASLRSAFRRNPKNPLVVGRLVDTFFAAGNFREVTEIYSHSAITDKTDEQTILRMAESFDKIGQITSSTALLELAINLKPQSGPLYLALASYYQRTGNAQKASEMEQKGRDLTEGTQQPGL